MLKVMIPCLTAFGLSIAPAIALTGQISSGVESQLTQVQAKDAPKEAAKAKEAAPAAAKDAAKAAPAAPAAAKGAPASSDSGGY